MSRPASLLYFYTLFGQGLALQLVQQLLMKSDKTSDDYEIVEIPTSTGAACLDGSPYMFKLKLGDDRDRWTFSIQGGGQCENASACESRLDTPGKASSTTIDWDDISSGCLNVDGNGNTYDCTTVGFPYCDGGYFLANVDDPVEAPGGSMLYLRGQRNLQAAIEILIESYGLGNATELAVTGHSAGGLATILNADSIAALVPQAEVRAVPDSGYSIDHEDVDGEHSYLEMMFEVHKFHKPQSLPAGCLEQYSKAHWYCMVAQYAGPHVKTPMFVVQSKHDPWAMTTGILGLDYDEIWKNEAATGSLEATVTQYGEDFLEAFEPFLNMAKADRSRGTYVASCVCHATCQQWTKTWEDGEDMIVKYGLWYEGLAESSAPAIYIEEGGPNYDCPLSF